MQVLWSDAVTRYLSENYDKKSLHLDIYHFNLLSPFLAYSYISDIDMSALSPFIQKRRLKDKVTNATVNRSLEIVRRVLRMSLEDWNYLQTIPKIKMLNEPKKRVRFLNKHESTLLLESLPSHLFPVVAFALSTGLRKSEILGLQWSRVDLNRKVAWLDYGTTKSGDAHGIPLNDDALRMLCLVKGIHPVYCFTYRGKRMNDIGSAWKRTLGKVGIDDFRFHDLRHTWASWHVMSGTTLPELMELGNWKSYSMVLRYAHIAPDHLLKASNKISLL